MPTDDKAKTLAFLSFISSAVVAYRRKVNNKALADHMLASMKTAAPLVKALGDAAALNAAKKIIIIVKAGKATRGQMPSPPYAQALLDFKTSLRKNLTRYYTSPLINEQQARLARSALVLFTPESATVDAKEAALDKGMHILPDVFLRTSFKSNKVHNQTDYLAELKFLVKSWTKRDGTSLSVDEAKKIRVKDPTRYKRFLQLKALIKQSYEQFVRDAVRANGGKPVKIATVVKDMEAAGIKQHPYKGLEPLYVGEDCSLYTSAGRMIVAMPAPGSKIVFNKNYDPKKDNGAVFMYRIPMSKVEGMKYAYTHDFIIAQRGKKNQTITKALTDVPKNRGKWVKDLSSADKRKQALAAMVELLYSQAMRIGGDANKTDGNATYGLSTLRVSHVALRNGGYVLTYPGKKSVTQKHVIKPGTPENDKIIAVMNRILRGKKRDDYVWSDTHGRITSGDVNAYMRSLGLKITAHKFRHVRGTALMQELLDKTKIAKGAKQSDVEKTVKGLAIKVGELLGHVSGEKVTPMTAIRSYIKPDIISNFFRSRGLRVPQWMPKGTIND